MSEFDLLNVKAEPSEDLITPDNSVFLFIDHQPQMFFGVGSDDRQSIINAAVGLAKASEAFNVPAVITTVAAESFSGHLHPALREVFPDAKVIDRTTMNSWEDERVVDAVKATGRRKILGQELLDTEHFPTIDFVSDPPLRTAGPDTYDLDGRLTLRGVTRTVALSLRFNGVTTDIWGPASGSRRRRRCCATTSAPGTSDA